MIKKFQFKNLTPWARLALDHWREWRPQMCKEMEEKGELELQAQRAADQAREEAILLESQGLSPDQSWEIVRNRYIYLEPEEGMEEEPPEDETYQLLSQAYRLMARAREEIDQKE